VSRIDERRAEFDRYKRDVEERGKPFHPYAMFHDTVMSLVVVSVIIGLAILWYLDSTEEPGQAGAGILGPRYEEEADPGTISFIPRPDWFFYFLFYLLRVFHWPESVILGTVGVPTILLILLLALPFLDVRRERRPLRRPVAVVAGILTIISMGTLTWKGATTQEATGAIAAEQVPRWMEENNLPAEAEEGANLFAQSGCLTCHLYLGDGTQNLGAPPLEAIGATGRTVEAYMEIIRQGPGAMPSFAALGDENIREIAIFLEASRGPGGG
jgi:menaquinol-cytochrome c reductase cytochrome b/c subunit